MLVIGGGAAGLTACYFAAKRGAEVTVLERTPEAGKKILISGGKRCNVLPMDVEIERDYFSESSKSAVRAVFAQWNLDGCKAWLEGEVGLRLAFEEGSSKYFPASNSAKEVRDLLLAACTRQGATFRYGSRLEKLTSEGQGWSCHLSDGSVHHGDRVIMATGGMSFPSMGTDGHGMRLLQKMRHTLHKPYPALTPLKGSHVASMQLAGLSIYEALLSVEGRAAGQKSKGRKAKVRATAEQSAMLFTHRGFSGPAILDLSHHLVKCLERQDTPPGLLVNWTNEGAEIWETRLKGGGSANVPSFLRQHAIPARLAEALALEAGVAQKQVAQLKKEEVRALVQSLVRYPLNCNGHEGYPKAEVTGGGTRLNDVDCSTMQSRVRPGLFLCGELLDVFGRIGGFNFYWAWLTGMLAGSAAGRSL